MARLCAALFSVRVRSTALLLLVDSTMRLILLRVHLLRLWISPMLNPAASFLLGPSGLELTAEV